MPEANRNPEQSAPFDSLVSEAETRTFGTLRPPVEYPPAAATNERIGAYRVIRTIGEGGMGIVYLAERTEGFRQKVAIKTIHAGLAASREILARFEAERQILADLNHPHIARLLDGGVAAQGWPYFVIEFVDGLSVDRYARGHRLDLEARLNIFRAICSAVSYAHKNLVIHRDLKPSNVLVTEDGTVKLLDFGIAKLQDPDQAPENLTRTHTGVRVLTPQYASPEQVRGEAVTTATDIYSLGVLLYELITGAKPYDLEGLTGFQVERTICEQEPEKPSLAAGRNEVEFHKSLQGDLDTVVLRALAKEPERRYSTVDQLDDDIRRFLFDLPVQARPDTFFYVTGKFVRRYRLFVVMLSALFVSLLAISAGLVVATVRLRAEKERATAERLQAESVTSFLTDLFRVSDPKEAQGRSISAREMLDRGSAKITHALPRSPATRARIMQVLGEVYDGLNAFDRSVALYESALEVERRAFGRESGEAAKTEYRLADVLLRANSDPERARRMAGHAFEVLSRLDGAASPDALQALKTRGEAEQMQGKWTEAERDARQAHSQLAARFGTSSAETASAAYLLGGVLLAQGKTREAAPPLREAYQTRRRVLGDGDPLTLMSLEGVALNLQDAGDLQGAEQALRQVLAWRRKILSPEAPGVAVAAANLGSVLQDEEKFDEAGKLYREAYSIDERAFGGRGLEPALTLLNLADLSSDEGRDVDAEKFGRESLAGFTAVGPHHPYRINASQVIAVALLRQKRFAEAEQVASANLAEARQLLGVSAPLTLKIQASLGLAREGCGERKQARQLLQDSYEQMENSSTASKASKATLALWWGQFLLRQRDFRAALTPLEQAYRLRSELRPENSLLRAEAELAWAQSLAAAGRCAEAGPHWHHGYAVYEAQRGSHAPEAVKAHQSPGSCPGRG